jgi:hypothetical protein
MHFRKSRLFSSARAAVVLDSILFFLFTAWMIRPLFQLKYVDRWISIESTFISDARYLAEHWPHPWWQPLWYTGTRFDYIYPPLLRYGTAALTRLFPIIPAKAYHIYCAVLYCIGIVAVYLLVRVAARSRPAACYAAVGTLLLSPALLFIPRLHVEGWHRAPQRIVVLTQWGEGPHMSALAILPLALVCAFLAFERKSPAALAGAAFFSALVVSSNFYGATALAIFFPVLVWSFWITHQEKSVFARAALIALLAWGLCAFWLVPSYLKVTIENLKYVSAPGTTWSVWILVAVAIGYLLLSDRYARGRRERVWQVFVIGAIVFFMLDELGNEYFDFRVAGEPQRLVPELDLVLTLGLVEVARRLWRGRRFPAVSRIAAVVLVAGSLGSSARYVKRHDVFFPRDWQYQQRPEYRIQEWIGGHLPDARTLVAGSVRFWYDTWQDLAQLGGGSDQGINNGIVVAAQWQILLSDNADVSIEWLRALGVDAVVVDGPESKEMYHDFVYPKKFAGRLPVLFDNHEGDIIYGVPRHFPGIARVVERSRLEAIHVFGRDPAVEALRAYADVVERGPDAAATVNRQGSDSFRLHASLAPGQALVVQESWDPAWHAWTGGREVRVGQDPMGFMTVAPGPGEQNLLFVFQPPLENAVGRGITALTLLLIAGLCIMSWRGRQDRTSKD